jgi:3-hydroxyacyl-[acyl-carrier-protein] dehydratase
MEQWIDRSKMQGGKMMSVVMDVEQIKEIIPHRDPMLLVDSVLELVPGERVRTSLFLNPDRAFFKGHFPGNPVMPGVLTVESMAQTSGVLLLSLEKYVGMTPYFIGIDKVSFRRKIEPNDTIEIESKIIRTNEAKAVVTCEAVVYNKGEVSTTGEVTLAMR